MVVRKGVIIMASTAESIIFVAIRVRRAYIPASRTTTRPTEANKIFATSSGVAANLSSRARIPRDGVLSYKLVLVYDGCIAVTSTLLSAASIASEIAKFESMAFEHPYIIANGAGMYQTEELVKQMHPRLPEAPIRLRK
mmetsp:Transcript_44038/g.108114  ORF Transcript_44038/g.108114 Transcript_44038/m.108114 type:complete len:139 (+) Transcript_44038:704-1120(+)